MIKTSQQKQTKRLNNQSNDGHCIDPAIKFGRTKAFKMASKYVGNGLSTMHFLVTPNARQNLLYISIYDCEKATHTMYCHSKLMYEILIEKMNKEGYPVNAVVVKCF